MEDTKLLIATARLLRI